MNGRPRAAPGSRRPPRFPALTGPSGVSSTDAITIDPMNVLRTGLVVATLLMSVGCSDGPLQLASIQTGRALNPDRSMSSITTLFKPSETIYVSVQTTAAGKGSIGVKWMYQGRVIDEPVKQVDYDGPASTEFHLQNPGVFPEGDYSVEIFIDGKPVGTRSFKVSS